MFKSRTISIPIYRSYEEVYDFLAEPRNFPSWASNLGADFVQIGENDWATTTRSGRVILRFAPRNAFGILDHREGDPVLDRCGRVRSLRLDPDLRAAVEQPVQPDVGGVADRLEDIGGLHERISFAAMRL